MRKQKMHIVKLTHNNSVDKTANILMKTFRMTLTNWKLNEKQYENSSGNHGFQKGK